MEEQIAELEKTGATEVAGKLREAWKTHSTALDTLKADADAARKGSAKLEKDLAKARADLESSGKTVDERVSALSKERDTLAAERDTHKTAAEQRAADLENHKLRSVVADEHFGDIGDRTARKRAIDVFFSEYRPESAGFDEKGKLQGFKEAVDAFKKSETWAYPPAEAGHGGGRSGSDPAPKVSPKGGEPAAAAALLKDMYPNDFKQKGA